MSTTLEERLRSAILANSTVANLLGSRLFLMQLPQNPVFPCAVYQRISTVPLTTMRQVAPWQQSGWCRFSITVWANGADAGHQTDTIARAIQTALLSFNGFGSGVNQSPNFLLSRSMGIEPNVNPPLFTSRSDYQIYYSEDN